MKKLLIASSALVAAAGSAAALDVSLGGEISISTDINVDNSGFDGANWDAGFTLKASGESMGWTYGGTIEVAMAQTTGMNLSVGGAEVYMGGDFMGKVAIKDSCGDFVENDKAGDSVGATTGDHCLQWTGFEAGGMGVSVAMGLDQGNTDLMVGLSGDMAGLAVDLEYDVNSEMFDAQTELSLGGMTVGVEATGASDFDTFNYALITSMDVSGFGVTLEYTPAGRATANGAGGKDIMAEITYGDCWTLGLGYDPVDNNVLAVTTDATTGAIVEATGDMTGLYMWEVEYECDLHDGVEISASLGQTEAAAGGSTTGTIGGVAVAAAELGGMKGSIGATVTF